MSASSRPEEIRAQYSHPHCDIWLSLPYHIATFLLECSKTVGAKSTCTVHGKVFPPQLLQVRYITCSRNPQTSFYFVADRVFPLHWCCLQSSNELTNAHFTHVMDELAFFRKQLQVHQAWSSISPSVLQLLSSTAALRSRCTVHHLLCWDEGPPTALTCSHLPSTCIVPRLPSAVEDRQLHDSFSPQHPFMYHYIPYICNLSATHILQWATYTCFHRPSCPDKLHDCADVTKRPCCEMAGHLLLTLFLQLRTSIQQEILLCTWYCVKYICNMACLTVSVSQNCRRILFCILVTKYNIHSVFSAFTSGPTSLQAPTAVSVVFFAVFTLPLCILTLHTKGWCVPFRPSVLLVAVFRYINSDAPDTVTGVWIKQTVITQNRFMGVPSPMNMSHNDCNLTAQQAALKLIHHACTTPLYTPLSPPTEHQPICCVQTQSWPHRQELTLTTECWIQLWVKLIAR
jgi:hypothetical protein